MQVRYRPATPLVGGALHPEKQRIFRFGRFFEALDMIAKLSSRGPLK